MPISQILKRKSTLKKMSVERDSPSVSPQHEKSPRRSMSLEPPPNEPLSIHDIHRKMLEIEKQNEELRKQIAEKNHEENREKNSSKRKINRIENSDRKRTKTNFYLDQNEFDGIKNIVSDNKKIHKLKFFKNKCSELSKKSQLNHEPPKSQSISFPKAPHLLKVPAFFKIMDDDKDIFSDSEIEKIDAENQKSFAHAAQHSCKRWSDAIDEKIKKIETHSEKTQENLIEKSLKNRRIKNQQEEDDLREKIQHEIETDTMKSNYDTDRKIEEVEKFLKNVSKNVYHKLCNVDGEEDLKILELGQSFIPADNLKKWRGDTQKNILIFLQKLKSRFWHHHHDLFREFELNVKKDVKKLLDKNNIKNLSKSNLEKNLSKKQHENFTNLKNHSENNKFKLLNTDKNLGTAITEPDLLTKLSIEYLDSDKNIIKTNVNEFEIIRNLKKNFKNKLKIEGTYDLIEENLIYKINNQKSLPKFKGLLKIHKKDSAGNQILKIRPIVRAFDCVYTPISLFINE